MLVLNAFKGLRIAVKGTDSDFGFLWSIAAYKHIKK
jgi:hypothetical protein